LEVSQIARSVARALNLNEDLTEAISLGHDLGHTPFGHVGEDVLNELYHGGFRHNEQSLRVVDILENNGVGLNLTLEVRDGILKHSKNWADILDGREDVACTLEGQICKVADAVAYINHDVDDAIRGGIIEEGNLPREVVDVLGRSHRERINSLVVDIVVSSASTMDRGGTPHIGMSKEVRRIANLLRRFLFEMVYSVASDESEEHREALRSLYAYFTAHAEDMPHEYRLRDGDIGRCVVDYISGMTDRYAMETFRQLCAGS